VIQDCNVTDYDYGFDTSATMSNSIIRNNNFTAIDNNAVYITVTTCTNLSIDNNYIEDTGSPAIRLYHGYKNSVISNNYIRNTNSLGFTMEWDIDNVNITNNTFNYTGSSQEVFGTISGDSTDNNFYKNIFYGRGFLMTETWAGKTASSLVNNNYCVDDGSGAIGNAYWEGAGYERPVQDCGPFPNIGTLEVNDSYDGGWSWDATTNGVDVNMSNIKDAVANAPWGGLVNVTTTGPYTEEVDVWYRDNVTLDCNSIGRIDNDGTSGNGLDIEFSYNFTLQNCSIDDFSKSIYMDESNNINILNNTFTSSNSYGVHVYEYSDNLLIDRNTFNEEGDTPLYLYHSIDKSVISNNYFKESFYNAMDLPWDSDYNNITGNIFNISGNVALSFSGDSTNNMIWNNDFIGRDTDQVTTTSGNKFNHTTIGNYWRNKDSQSEGCTDLAPVDGICDSPVEIDTGTGAYDNYAKTNQIFVDLIVEK